MALNISATVEAGSVITGETIAEVTQYEELISRQ